LKYLLEIAFLEEVDMGDDLLLARGPAINEGVSLLHSLSPSALEKLRIQHPLLSNDLKVGILAGVETENLEDRGQIVHEKAQIMICALSEAETAASQTLKAVAKKITSARRQRLWAQLLVLVGSSSSLATMAFGKNAAAIVCAVLTLLAAIGNLIADYKEKLLNPQTGNIYDAYQRLSESSYRTKTLATDLTVGLKYNQDVSELEPMIAKGNVLCEELNNWLIQMSVTNTLR
jgi:hypothetical protein